MCEVSVGQRNRCGKWFIGGLLIACLLGAAQAGWPAAPADAGAGQEGVTTGSLATIRLYNPTDWTSPTTVEIPTGHLAAPGLVDWANVRLLRAGQEIPFALREGRAHWKAQLTAPVAQPRAEDLLVFSVALSQGVWAQLELVSGKPAAVSALRLDGANWVVSYADLTVNIDATTGMLRQLQVGDVSMLQGPLQFQLSTVGAGVVNQTGPMGVGYDYPSVTVATGTLQGPVPARLVSSSSNGAMTELNFALEPAKGPALALTYRIHASGLVEIWSDERPWTPPSPWVGYAVKYSLAPAGQQELLPYLQNRAPYYGFKDYWAAVNFSGSIYRTADHAMLEVGEETINGRRWNRQFYLPLKAQTSIKPGRWLNYADRMERGAGRRTGGGVPFALAGWDGGADPSAAKWRLVAQAALASSPQSPPDLAELVKLATEGVIVQVDPLSMPLAPGPVTVSCDNNETTIGRQLVDSLSQAGVSATLLAGGDEPTSQCLVLELLADPQAQGIAGDGFAIRPRGTGLAGVTLTAGTRFGLMQAVLKAKDYWSRQAAGVAAVPLIASNPAVDLRAGGFGGGTQETDFPYASDRDWQQAVDGLIHSGMNVMTCQGMWSNWKMPVAYKYMPELFSNAPGAYDEVTGSYFAHFEQDRARGLKLLNYLRARGVKVWLWVPVGAVPTTFAQLYPDSMTPNNQKVPRVMDAKYRAYLNAFFKELLETYQVDGFIMIRDDNGGIDNTPEYQQYLAQSRTKDPVWEQYLILYDLLHGLGFQGALAVYPYNDMYTPRLDPLLPPDLIIGGHGSGLATLSRNYEVVGPMGDTWLDTVYASFRVPPATRMKRLLADRGSYWIGGAYTGSELPWEAPGVFGWQPTATVNTFRYNWGWRKFGSDQMALTYTALSAAGEHLWDIFDLQLLPNTWLNMLTAAQRSDAAQDGRATLATYRDRLGELQTEADAVHADAAPAKASAKAGVRLATATSIIVKQDGSGPGGYKTINAGLTAAGMNGTVTVMDNGTYEENNGLLTAAGYNLTLQAGAGFTPTLKCSQLVPGWYYTFIYMMNSGSVTIDGFKIVGNGGKTFTPRLIQAAGAGTASHITLSNCLISGDWGYMVWIDRGVGSTLRMFRDRLFMRNHLGLCRTMASGCDLNWEQCALLEDPAHDPGYNGQWLYFGGLSGAASATVMFTNCIIGSGCNYIFDGTPKSFALQSCVYDPGWKEEAVTTDANCLQGDALLKDPAAMDFTLTPYSPALGTGNGVNGAVNIGWDQVTRLQQNNAWLAYASLYGTFFDYSLQRIELLEQLRDLVQPYKATLQGPSPLPEPVRQQITSLYQATYQAAEPFTNQVRLTPGLMMQQVAPMTPPYKEWVGGGFTEYLEWKLDVHQFAGTLSAAPAHVPVNQPFTLTITLHNRGLCPWIPGVGHQLLLSGDAQKLGLPSSWDLSGDWVLPGDVRTVTLQGTAPATTGSGQIKIRLMTPFWSTGAFIDQNVTLQWP